MSAPKDDHRDRWLQLALVAVCAAQQGVECTDDALAEALFAGMPSVRVDDVTAAAVAEALRRTSSIKDAAEMLDRSRGFIYDSLRRRRREWNTADWVGYGAEVRRRRLRAGWSLTDLGRLVNLSITTLREVERPSRSVRPSELTLAKLASALGMPLPPVAEPAGK